MEKNKKCKIKGKQEYFLNKYGTYQPEIIIEGTDKEVCGLSWIHNHTIASVVFMERLIKTGKLDRAYDEIVYYGKVQEGLLPLGEFVLESELEEVEDLELFNLKI